MRFRLAVFTIASAACASLAGAQGFTGSGFAVDGRTASVTLTQPNLQGPPPVVGAPYTADRVTESVQTLADGTHIRQPKTIEHLVRDSQGRTRREHAFVPGVQTVEIIDPVAGFGYVLDEQNKVAHRVTLQARPQPNRVLMVAPGGGLTREGAEVVRRSTVPQSVTENLATKNIEGVLAEGHRFTRTYPVDSAGNDRPMVDVDETWYSKELRETVYMKMSSARHGDHTTQLLNIDRAEPPIGMFQPPADYTVVDDKDQVKLKLNMPRQ